MSVAEKTTLIVPSGVGDWVWIANKLHAARDQIEKFLVLGGSPRRTTPFIQLAGYDCEYIDGVDYEMILRFEEFHKIDQHSNPTWELVRAVGPNVMLEANSHLEAGRPIVDWLPDLPVEYHIPLFTTDDHRKRATKLMHEVEGQYRVGISCASYQGSAAWDTWKASVWVDFIKRVQAEGWTPVLVGGGWDDLTMEVADDLGVACFVGRTQIGTCVEILRELEAYVGFSSGLNVIRTVLDKPALAFWPHHQQELSHSWAPPEMVESRRYIGRLWCDVDEMWRTATRFLRACADEADREPRLKIVGG